MPFYTGHVAATSNRADFLFKIVLTDPITNDRVDFTGATITIALRQTSQRSPTLVGTNLDGHITVVGPGEFDTHFTRAEMTQFPPGDVDIGVVVMLRDGITYQLIAGQVPVVDGVVAA